MIEPMMLALLVALIGVVLLIVIRRKHLGVLMPLASLLCALLIMIWLQDHGYLPGPGIDRRATDQDAQ